jgi:hypothetical protein
MSITLQLAPGLEASLRDTAAREGVDTTTLVLRTLERQFGPESKPTSSSPEADLVLKISEGPSEATWQRYHELSEKRDAETLSTAEYAELTKLSESIESADVRRLEFLTELATLRGTTLSVVRDQLGIPNTNRFGGTANA